MRSSPLIALLVSALSLGAVGCGHDLKDGVYRATVAGAPMIDNCGLLAGVDALPSLDVIVLGQELRIKSTLLASTEPLRFVGRYKRAKFGEPEQFSADATTGAVAATRLGAACTIAFGQVHLEASLFEDRNDAFFGTFSLREDLERTGDASCPDQCELRVLFQASQGAL